MILKEKKPELRIEFLKIFTKEIILTKKREIEIENKIAAERIKRELKLEEEKLKPSLIIKSQDNPTNVKNKIIQKEKIHLPNPIKKAAPFQNPVKKIYPAANDEAKKEKNMPRFQEIPRTSKMIDPSLIASPYPSNKEKIDLGKINHLLEDPAVTSIECSGPGKNIVVKTYGSTKITNIVLSEKEILEILEKLSKESKIPLSKGMFKAAIKNFIISAITSELIGSRFIITKMPLNLMQNYN